MGTGKVARATVISVQPVGAIGDFAQELLATIAGRYLFGLRWRLFIEGLIPHTATDFVRLLRPSV